MKTTRKQKQRISGIITGAFALLFLIVFSNPSHAAFDKVIRPDQLPSEARQLISKHFPDREVSVVKTDYDFFSKTYEVLFPNGDKLEFDSKGRWKEIDCPQTFVPEELVPASIKGHVQQHYPQAKIVKIQYEDKVYEVELNNRIELEFNRNYELIDLDSES